MPKTVGRSYRQPPLHLAPLLRQLFLLFFEVGDLLLGDVGALSGLLFHVFVEADITAERFYLAHHRVILLEEVFGLL